ncbi:hypothetical protein COO60DRAFT_1702424 [Scenedesmus sp. NREL 46B-D3]|nr:hypothetical protein COO60DRAFT_1702424 [Scenedesmus sp. NREL 46B-D3]
MTLPLLLLATWLFTIAASTAATAQSDVISCGGFVSVSSHLQAALKESGLGSVDLSSVQVQLLSPQGVKKSEGDCSPNGYYFVPVEAGAYSVQVRAQPGWVFTPQEVQISCSSQSCNGGEDVNFELTGFELRGHVEAAAAAASCKAAPAAYLGISIAVRPAHSSAKAAATGPAQVSGSSFATGPLLPGSYVITASHPDWTLSPARITHTLGPDSAQLPEPFTVTGYTLSGSVTSRSGPVAGVQVTLLTSDVTAAGCSATHPPGHVEAADLESALSTTALCSVLSGQDGRYSFPGVPCGQYTLQATHPDTGSRFEIEPSSQDVAVGHSNAAAPEAFVVAGFSVQGRVVDGSGDGVAGVEIRVGGELKTTTDLNGRYSLTRMSEGRVEVTATKRHHSFSNLAAAHITPSAAVLPDIVVTSLALCGRLEHGEQQFKGAARRVSLVSNDGAGVTQQTTADAASGAFCFASVPPGRYRVAPYVSAGDKAKGLLFSPSHVDLQLAGQPLVNVVFSQAQLSVAGEVECLGGPCPGDVQLVLRGADGKVAASVRLDDVAVKDKQSTGKSIRYMLPRVSPGRYTLAAARAGWCWQAAQGVELVVESSDVRAAPLQQAGYELQVTASHPTTLGLTGFPQQYSAAPGGTTNICIPTTGQLLLTTSSCFVFGPNRGIYTIDVSPEHPLEPLSLQAETVNVAGELAVSAGSTSLTGSDPETADSTDSSSANSLPRVITIAVADPGSSNDAAQVVQAVARDPARPWVYSYGLTIHLGASVVLTPSVDGSSSLLLHPRSRIYTHDAASRECPPAVAAFEAKPGRMLAGVVEPAVEGADVKALFQSASAAAGRAAGDVAAQTTTDAAGSFRLGPLYRDAEYSVQLSKTGHIITPPAVTTSPSAASSADVTEQLLRFVSKQLASVAVAVDLPAGTNAAGVFLSLSGSGGFKSNARLGPDSSLTFHDLQPGTYYLKPLLREHQFEPPVADLALGDGQAATVTLTAVRNAWGISGAVVSVGGSPLAGAVVEACQGSGAAAIVLDSSATDELGEYRIGNLKPGVAYQIRVRLDGRVVGAHPAAQQVNLQRADVTGVDFIAFRTLSRPTLSAALQLPSELRSAIKAELMSAGSSSSRSSSTPSTAGATVLAAVAVDGSGFFEMRGLKPGAYVLRLSCIPAAAGGRSCEPWELPVQVPAKDIHLGILPYKAAPLASATSSAAAGTQLSDEGLDWKAPVMVLLLLAAGSATVFKPTIIDILQLRAPLSAPANGNSGGAAGAAAAPRQGTSSRADGAPGAASGRAAAVAAAAAAPLPVGVGATAAAAEAAAAAAAGLKNSSEWLDDNEMRGMGMKQRGASSARRTRRA